MNKLEILPRLVMELSRTETAAVLCHTPCFVSESGELNRQEMCQHARDLLQSKAFLGFMMTSICECEDLVEKLNMYPHVFLERTFIYRPTSPLLAELCMLLSMLENLQNPTRDAVVAILQRARELGKRSRSVDAAYVAKGIETVGATIFAVSGLNAEGLSLASPLVMYKFYACIEKTAGNCTAFLKDIYLSSKKMMTGIDDQIPESRIPFNIFYEDTVMTRHYQNKEVVRCLKIAALFFSSRKFIFLR